MKSKLLIPLVLIAVLVGCTSDIASITVPDIPEPGQISGAWAGNARWDALQGGALGAVSSGAATAILFQSSASILSGSQWEVTGLYTGTLSGTVNPDGNATGTATVNVTGAGCQASAPWGGQVEGDHLSITMSFADGGSAPCPGAPVGLTLNLSR